MTDTDTDTTETDDTGDGLDATDTNERDATETDTSDATAETTVRRLDEATRRKIAAGEVVTRPASVVKELVENSLDAGASKIVVAVDGDGTERLSVRDDGHGMSETDAERAVERHATSKISAPDDVDRVSTLGFRGEALPSIASVATLTLTTNDGGPRGVEVAVGRESRPEGAETRPAGRARGTTVTVRDLFANRPARRKNLASPSAEFARISRLLQRYALLHPDVAFSLSHDGRETFSTPGSGATDALLGVYDRRVAGESTTVDSVVEGSGRSTGTDRLSVQGVVCYPSITRATRDHVHVAVDGRPLADETIRRAVVDGYGSLLPAGRAPVVALDVSLPPGSVDHNVHPSKAEVALREEERVTAAVEGAVRDALSTADLRRSADVAMDLESSLRRVESDSRFDDISVIGQFRGLYLLCEDGDDLLVVDQHAAHERVNYERLRDAVGDVPSVDVDPPATLSVAPDLAAVVEGERAELTALGYAVASLGGGTLAVRAVPAPLGRTADPESLRDVLGALSRGASADVRDDLLADLACHPSLKAGDDLSTEDGERLLERLGACEQPYACPHGRPTVLAIEETAFVRGFERHARLE